MNITENLHIPVYCPKATWQVFKVKIHMYIDPEDKNLPPDVTYFPDTCPHSDHSVQCARCALAVVEMLKANKISNLNSPINPDFSLLE